MKKKWRYNKYDTLFYGVRMLLPILIGIAAVFLIPSCSQQDKHKHIPTNKASDLDGLVQPTNQTVFSTIKTISPTEQSITPIINATGIISYDPRLISTISAKFNGRIEKLYVRFNFEPISKGQRIMDIYSPEIVTAQQNLIFLLNSSSNDELINSSKQKLHLLGLTDEQLQLIVTNRKAINPLPVYSQYSGHIHDIGISGGVSSSSPMGNGMSSGMNTAPNSVQTQSENLLSSESSVLSIKEGMYVRSGQSVFGVYDMGKVWAVLNIFSQDATLVKAGNKVTITSEANPTKTIISTISYIEPIIEQNTYTVKARVYLQNPENLNLKIGTLITAKITSSEKKGSWLPRNAIVTVGKNQIVFIKTEDHFITRIIQTGITTDSLVQIINGLKGNELVAANAQYMVDSESFIQTNEHE